MTERKLSALQKEYRSFFLGKLKLYGVSSPAHLTKTKKSEFFTSIKTDWAKIKLEKKRKKKPGINQAPPRAIRKSAAVEESKPTYSVGNGKSVESVANSQLKEKKVIRSIPNEDQTDDLRILFNPHDEFEQDKAYVYPVVKMPKPDSRIKLPRSGRTNQKGYKEKDFFRLLKRSLKRVEIINDVHLLIPNFSKPYEPDFVLCDKSLNLYIDIEIDEPYDGYYRHPTHYIDPEDDFKKDNVRDLFFTESGWIVIRFTEKQVHCQADECIFYLKNVLESIYEREFSKHVRCETEEQWDYNQCIQWQKFFYREKYLGIPGFKKQQSQIEIEIDLDESESIEQVIDRTKMFSLPKWNSSIAFDEESHKYLHPNDQTGNAEYTSVTTLIERFFPFDLKRYIERKALNDNRTEEDVLGEYLLIRDEASEKGTYLHNQIENFLKGLNFDSKFTEFKMFMDFYNNEIKKRSLVFHEAEKMVFSTIRNIAGTIDCLFKKEKHDEFVMLDWKRSKKLIIDGRPRMYGYGYALSDLNTLDNSSFNRYCLQQNLYKHLLETEYSMKVSSMKLVVLHENYPDYYVINVPQMKRETTIILNSLQEKI